MVLCQSLGNHLNFLLNTLIIKQATQCSSYCTEAGRVQRCVPKDTEQQWGIRHWDQSSLKKKFQITSVYVHTRPGAHRRSGLSWSSRVAGNWTLEEQYRLSTAEASLQPTVSTLEQAETTSLEGRQLCCTPSFIRLKASSLQHAKISSRNEEVQRRSEHPTVP